MRFNISFKISGRPPVAPADEPSMEIRVASPAYFSTLGIPVKRGRGFTDRDTASTPQVVLITERAAKQFFPNEDPLGKTITLGWGKTGRDGVRQAAGGQIVGIVGDVKDAGLDEPNPPQLYLPLRQWPVGSMAVVLKTSIPPGSLTEAARNTVYAVDANLPVSNVRTLEQIVERSVSQPRFYMLLLGVFAALALTLAAIGIFGVLSYAVSQRTREIGIRMALGAQGSSVIAMVVRQATVLVAAGLLAGTVAALFVSRALTVKFSVTPTDGDVRGRRWNPRRGSDAGHLSSARRATRGPGRRAPCGWLFSQSLKPKPKPAIIDVSDVEYFLKQYGLQQGALEIQYIEEFFLDFPRKKTAAEVITRLADRDHQILMAEAPLPHDPGTVVPVSFKVAHELRANERDPKLADLVAQLDDIVTFDGRRVLYQWIGGTRSDWRGQGHFRALTEEQEVWALCNGFE
jgi:hypothetical protein